MIKKDTPPKAGFVVEAQRTCSVSFFAPKLVENLSSNPLIASDASNMAAKNTR